VIHEMKRHEINILGVSKTHWKQGGDLDSHDIRVIYAGGSESHRGVDLLLDETATKCVTQLNDIKMGSCV